MSASGGEADLCIALANVCFVPIGDIESICDREGHLGGRPSRALVSDLRVCDVLNARPCRAPCRFAA